MVRYNGHMKMNPVVHFEMPTKDKKRVADFYSKVFGWKMQQMGAEMGDYVLAQTAETDAQGMVQTPGTINGGFFEFKDEPGFNSPHVVISVEDINKSIADVKAAGGQVNGEIMDIPGIGKYVSFTDSEDNTVGILQPTR